MVRGVHGGRSVLFALLGSIAAVVACSSESGTTSFTAAGGSCSKASDCQSGSCFAGTCQAGSQPSGGACTTGADCQSGSCEAGTCKGGGVPLGGVCSAASDCQSNKCMGGVCKGGSAPSGATCKTGGDCQSGRCASGTCQGGSAPAGGTCTTGGDCQSGNCVSGTCQTGSSGACTPGTQGCACDSSSSCFAGLTCTAGTCCNAATHNCSPPSMNMGTGGGPAVHDGGSICQPGVTGPVITDCGYPYESSNALTNVLFNESEVLAAIVPTGGFPLASIQLFYNDEHALTLGVHQVVVNGVATDYPVSPLTANPGTVDAPQTGTNLLTGDQAGTDVSGRPMWPALFVTDTTVDPNAVNGDWQWGGTAWNPSYVAGTWKGAVRIVDATGASITPDADPAKNNQNYGNGHTAPAGALVKKEGYGAEVRWDMRLAPGHNYRFQVMVHDGDQNKVGGDTGEACVNYCAGSSCPAGSQACTTDADCAGGYCSAGCCTNQPPPPPPPPPPGDSGTCPPNWQTYILTEGQSMCTPPPTGGTCPVGYIVYIENNHQYCLPINIH